MFDHILKWKLLAGSHEFPGPDGGTCISEAAVVAAGFQYRSISSVHDCPLCFSPIIATYAIGLNDIMPNRLRQKLLLPFVTRLAGTADSKEKEARRAHYIVIQTMQRIMPVVLRVAQLEYAARACEQVDSLKNAVIVSREAEDDARIACACADLRTRVAAHKALSTADSGVYLVAADLADLADAAAAARGAAISSAIAANWRDPINMVGCAADAVGCAARFPRTRKKIFIIATMILDEAIRIGKQSEDVEVAVVEERMDKAKHPEDFSKGVAATKKLVAQHGS